MKKRISYFLAFVIATFTCINAHADSLSVAEKDALLSSYKLWKSLGLGIGSNAIKSPFGRYLILKNDETLLCLKLEKHLPSAKEGMHASKYSWVHLIKGKIEDSGTFIIDEDRNAGPYWIELAGFKCEWSFSDWVYFDENIPEMKMARTELTEEDELVEAEIEGWLSQKELETFTENDPEIRLLEKALKVEKGGAGQRR